MLGYLLVPETFGRESAGKACENGFWHGSTDHPQLFKMFFLPVVGAYTSASAEAPGTFINFLSGFNKGTCIRTFVKEF